MTPDGPQTSVEPLVTMTGITVRYPGQVALDHVDFRVFPGEVHSLMGENGAGKSTLIKALTGAQRIDEGSIRLRGAPVSFGSTAEATAAGISAVYQEVNLLPNLSVAENVMLGREVRGRFGIDWRRTHQEASRVLARLGLHIDPASTLVQHAPGVRQLVAIARAISTSPSVLILDEPTSSLDEDEVRELFAIIRGLRDSGVAVLFISHFLEQVYEIADRLTVLRNGELVGEFPTRAILRRDLVRNMLGRDIDVLDQLGGRTRELAGGEVPPLSARGVRTAALEQPFDLDVAEGEVIGFAGLLGSGRTEVARALAGIDPLEKGQIVLAGKRRRLRTPRAAIGARVVYSSEDRRTEGIVADLTVRENIVLALQAQRGWFRPISRARQDELATSYIEALRILPADPNAPAGSLSGGNQQKVLLARWLAIAPRILILDEPTRGIDVGAKVEIQRLVTSLADNGISVLYISAELDEVIRLSDRIVVMRDHEIVSVLSGDSVTREGLLAIIAEGADADGET
jgi:galactofuranose transport system ATP-binding protein